MLLSVLSAFLANVLDLICSNTYAAIFPVLRYYICLEGKPAPLCIVQSKQVRQPRKSTQLRMICTNKTVTRGQDLQKLVQTRVIQGCAWDWVGVVSNCTMSLFFFGGGGGGGDFSCETHNSKWPHSAIRLPNEDPDSRQPQNDQWSSAHNMHLSQYVVSNNF